MLEKLLGRELHDGQVVPVQTNPILKPARELKEAMDDRAAQVAPDATDELDRLIDEAVDAVRGGRW